MSFNSKFAFQCKKPPLDLQICFYRQYVCSQDIQDQAEAGQEGQAEPSHPPVDQVSSLMLKMLTKCLHP